MRKWAELAFATFLVIFFAVAVISAQGWSFDVKLFPLAVGYPMLVVSLLNLASTVRTMQKEAKEERARPVPVAAADVAESGEPAAAGDEESQQEAAGDKPQAEATTTVDYRAAYQGASQIMMGPEQIDPKVLASRAIGIILWMLGSFGIIWVVGLKFGIPFWMFLFLRFQSKEKIWVALVLSIAGFLFLVGFFDRVVHVPWPDSQLTHWFGWDVTFWDGWGFFLEYP